ncbi:polyprenyl synthetase family protein [Antrihabitans spumae]|uniref:Polyprenyl synthetase family protein n=1 Tax=Antrihabitans spumae TaxID=3373370 RepID=A0ABW7KJN3_9NOCA
MSPPIPMVAEHEKLASDVDARQEFATAVHAVLAEFFETQQATVGSVGPVFADAVEVLKSFVLNGGKRVRPSFTWAGWLGAGGSPDSDRATAVLTVAAAQEFIQASALIHDDVMDESSTRRGAPSVHVQFANRHRRGGWEGDSRKYGEAIAILLGDLGLCWADDMLRSAYLRMDEHKRVAPVWSAMRTEVIGGQVLDIATVAERDESEAAALRIDRYKTAAYTVERPLHLGAELAGAGPDLIRAYRQFGVDIGIAFQLRDDLLGVFGDPVVTGKPIGDDLREGKRTVLLALALQRANPKESALLRRCIGTAMSDNDLARVCDVLRTTGVVEDLERRIERLTDRAIVALETSEATPTAQRLLRGMALSATRREA